jgi:hypothetical protein
MIDDNQNAIDLSLVTQGLASNDVKMLLDPAQDPACKLPDFLVSKDDYAPAQANTPPIDDIEKALNDHVRDGIPPHKLIQSLFYPFLESKGHLSLNPGKGKKRPSYELEVEPFGYKIYRTSTRDAAERLHTLATSLATLAVGDRAPEGSPTFIVEVSGSSYLYTEYVPVRAPDIQTARQAYITAFSSAPGSVRVNLNKTPDDIIPHVLAAREILAEEQVGAPVFRRQAVDLIAAIEDLRAAVTIALRRTPKINRYGQYWVDITPGQPNEISITDDGEADIDSNHNKLKIAAKYRVLTDAVNDVLSRHKVLDSLPEDYQIRFSGELQFLLAQIINPNAPTSSRDRSISFSLLEYSKITELAEELERIHKTSVDQEQHWKLSVSGRLRCKSEWNLKGKTLAHAIARETKEQDSRSSMALFDLLIDLYGDSNGEPVEVELYRVL